MAKFTNKKGEGCQVFVVESITVDKLHDKVELMESKPHTNQSRRGDIIDTCNHAPDYPSH